MANALYSLGRQGILDGSINMASDTIKAMLVTSGYTPNTSTHQYVSDVGSGNIVVRSGALTTKSETGGVFNADNVVIASVSGSVVSYIVLYKDTGSDTTSRLVAIIDTATNLPYTPNGSNVTIAWDAGVNKIFAI